MNPFDVLGVSHKSTPKEIDRAYRNLAKKYHPDINPNNPEAEKKFKEIQNAYEFLSNKKSSNINFRTRRPPPSGFDFGFDFFSQSTYKGRSIQVHTEITLLEVLTGCQKDILYKKNNICKNCIRGFTDFLNCEHCGGTGQMNVSEGPFHIRTICAHCIGKGKIGVKKCETCHGSGNLDTEETTINISIPPGAESGMQLVFEGQGEESLNGGINGDLIVIISIKEHPLFKREGPNLVVDVPVTYSHLCLGHKELHVPCITNEIVIIKIPESCPPNTKFRVKGKGVFAKGRIGDMIVNLKLEVPKNISSDHKDILIKLLEMEKNWHSISQENLLKSINNT